MLLSDVRFYQIIQYAEDYPNYIFALTMGLGKTILMATCIFYEFLLASKWPRDDRYCHNALVSAMKGMDLWRLVRLKCGFREENLR